jgi:uncharacterized protein
MIIPRTIIGRKTEQETLQRLFLSNKSEFVILYGRRRVGKTFLINQIFKDKLVFRATAVANTTKSQQLISFHTYLKTASPEMAQTALPQNWFEAFQLLIALLTADKTIRKVVYLDELPWFDGHNSDFIQALEHFWNGWAANRDDILLISCGSSAYWMINELIHNKGGLHNRITERILLKPFTLSETETFLKSKGGNFDRYQIVQLYMAMGGIPFYLEQIQVNRSIAQNIDRLFFYEGAMFQTEYADLYRSLFKNAERHIAIIEALANKATGLERKELVEATKLPNGGSITQVLEELQQSGFIRKYLPFGKKKRDAIYQLIDPYTLFYHSFVKNSKAEGPGVWLVLSESARYRTWCGYAFEIISYYHVGQIKQSLGFASVYTEVSTWRSKMIAGGAQIDLVLDRNDRVVNLIEIKFHTSPFAITKDYAEKLKNKRNVFKEETETRKAVFLTLLTTFGLTNNEHAAQIVTDSIDLEALYAF